MSVRAECWAFGAEVSSSLQRVVLMGLATFADEHDEVVVSASVLTRIAVAGRRELWSTLAELESAGLLEVVRTADVALASDEVPARLLVPEAVVRPWSPRRHREVIGDLTVDLPPRSHVAQKTAEVSLKPSLRRETPSRSREDVGVRTVAVELMEAG